MFRLQRGHRCDFTEKKNSCWRCALVELNKWVTPCSKILIWEAQHPELRRTVQFLTVPRNCSPLHSIRTGSGAHLASYHRVKAAGVWNWPFVSTRCWGSKWQSYISTFMARCLINLSTEINLPLLQFTCIRRASKWSCFSGSSSNISHFFHACYRSHPSHPP
jgi:hypothetical protein